MFKLGWGFLQSLFVLDWLDRGVVMMLMHLLVNSGGQVLMTMRVNMLLGDGGADIFVDDSLVLSISREEVGGGLSSSLHDEMMLLRWV